MNSKTACILALAFLAWGCAQSEAPEDPCQQHVVLRSAAEGASITGKSEEEAQREFKVDLWKKAGATDPDQVIGRLDLGSTLRVLEIDGAYFKVANPADGSEGWVNAYEVGRIVILDVNTGEPCGEQGS